MFPRQFVSIMVDCKWDKSVQVYSRRPPFHCAFVDILFANAPLVASTIAVTAEPFRRMTTDASILTGLVVTLVNLTTVRAMEPRLTGAGALICIAYGVILT